MQHRVYQTKVKDMDDLKRRLIEVWMFTAEPCRRRHQTAAYLCSNQRWTFWTLRTFVPTLTSVRLCKL